MALEEYLRDGERLVYVTNRHASVLVRPLLQLLVGFVLATLVGLVARLGEFDEVLDLAAGVIALVFSLNLMAGVWRWRAEEVGLTDRRLLETSGLIRRRVVSVPYASIVSVTVRRSGLARLLRAGDVVIQTGERGYIRVARLPRIKAFNRELLALASGEAPATHPDEADTGPLPRVRL